MASLKSSEIIANLGVGFDNKSLKKVTQGFSQMEKYYQNIINKMTKKESQQAQKTKKTLGKTLNEYKKMFKQVQKGSDNVDFSNMATGIGAVVEIASRAIGMLNKGNESTKNLIDSAVGLEKLGKNLNLDVESIQLLQQAGKPLGLEDSDIASFISSMNSASLALKRGESTQATATLQQLGVNRGDDTATIINKAFDSLSKQDVTMRERLLSSLGISDDLNRAFTQLTSKTEAEWKTIEKNNKAMTTSRGIAKRAFATDIAIDRRSKEVDKDLLEGDYNPKTGKRENESLSYYEKSTLESLNLKKEVNRGINLFNEEIANAKVWFLSTFLPMMHNIINTFKEAITNIHNSLENLKNRVSEFMNDPVGEFMKKITG